MHSSSFEEIKKLDARSVDAYQIDEMGSIDSNEFYLQVPLQEFVRNGEAIISSVADCLQSEERVGANRVAISMSEVIGPYELSEGYTSHLKQFDVELGEGSSVPYASPAESLEAISKTKAGRKYSIQEIVDVLQKERLEIVAWQIPEDSYTLVRSLLHATGKSKTSDSFLRLLETVEGHRIPELVLLVRKLSDDRN